MAGSRWPLVALLMGASAAGGWFARGRHMDAQAEVQTAVAATYKAQADEWKRTAEDADHAAEANGEKVLQHEKTIADLKAEMSRHARPGAIPPDAPVSVVVAALAQVEVRLGDCESLVRAQDTLEEIRAAQVMNLTAARDGWRNAYTAEKHRADALQVVSSPPRWSAGLGASIDPRTGERRIAVAVLNHLNRQWAIGGGTINGGAFVLAVRSW